MTGPGNSQSIIAVISLLILLGASAQAQDLWLPSGNDINNTNSCDVGIGTIIDFDPPEITINRPKPGGYFINVLLCSSLLSFASANISGGLS